MDFLETGEPCLLPLPLLEPDLLLFEPEPDPLRLRFDLEERDLLLDFLEPGVPLFRDTAEPLRDLDFETDLLPERDLDLERDTDRLPASILNI